MISNGSFSLILNLVSYLSCVNKLLNTAFYECSTLCYLTDNLDIPFTKLFTFYIPKDVHHVLNILSQLTLIVRCYRDNMVHCKVAHDACFNLNLLSVCLPFNLISSL